MKPLFKLVLGASLAAIPLVSSAIPGYVTDERGVIVRTDNPTLGIHECWHTSEWTPDMAVVGCDGKVETAQVEVPPPPAEPVYEPCSEHMTISDEGETLFAFNKARLSTGSMAKLDNLVTRLKTFHSVDKVVVTGHTDRIGSVSYNDRLSRRRAEAVRDYLLDRQAVDPNAVEVVAKGKREPVVGCEGVHPRKRLITCLAPNRRVVVDVNGTGCSK